MSDFPREGNAAQTAQWLSSNGLDGALQGWSAGALLNLTEEEIQEFVPDEMKADWLWCTLLAEKDKIEREKMLEKEKKEAEDREREREERQKNREIELRRIEAQVAMKRLEVGVSDRLANDVSEMSLTRVSAEQQNSHSLKIVQKFGPIKRVTGEEVWRFGTRNLQVDSAPSEKELSKKFFDALVGFFGGQLVACGNTPWLDTGATSLRKPDFFVLHSNFVRWNKPIDEIFHSQISIVFELKRNAGYSDMGQLHSYLHGLCETTRRNHIGILFDTESYILEEHSPNGIVRIEEVQWALPGSVDYLLEAVKQMESRPEFALSRTIKSVVNKFNLRQLHFLGCGGFGVVFAAIRESSSELVALKVVYRTAGDLVESEFEALQRFQSLKNEHVVKVDIETGLCREFELPFYFMLEVGSWFVANSSKKLRKVWKALQSLHELGYSHGDVRRTNVLNVNQEPKLIDFMNSRESTSDITQDVIQFCKHFLGVPPWRIHSDGDGT